MDESIGRSIDVSVQDETFLESLGKSVKCAGDLVVCGQATHDLTYTIDHRLEEKVDKNPNFKGMDSDISKSTACFYFLFLQSVHEKVLFDWNVDLIYLVVVPMSILKAKKTDFF